MKAIYIFVYSGEKLTYGQTIAKKYNIQQLNLMSIRSLVNEEIFILSENIEYKHLYMSVMLKM